MNDLAIPHDIVDYNESPRPDNAKRFSEIDRIGGLVRINKDEVIWA